MNREEMINGILLKLTTRAQDYKIIEALREINNMRFESNFKSLFEDRFLPVVVSLISGGTFLVFKEVCNILLAILPLFRSDAEVFLYSILKEFRTKVDVYSYLRERKQSDFTQYSEDSVIGYSKSFLGNLVEAFGTQIILQVYDKIVLKTPPKRRDFDGLIVPEHILREDFIRNHAPGSDFMPLDSPTHHTLNRSAPPSCGRIPSKPTIDTASLPHNNNFPNHNNLPPDHIISPEPPTLVSPRAGRLNTFPPHFPRKLSQDYVLSELDLVRKDSTPLNLTLTTVTKDSAPPNPSLSATPRNPTLSAISKDSASRNPTLSAMSKDSAPRNPTLSAIRNQFQRNYSEDAVIEDIPILVSPKTERSGFLSSRATSEDFVITEEPDPTDPSISTNYLNSNELVSNQHALSRSKRNMRHSWSPTQTNKSSFNVDEVIRIPDNGIPVFGPPGFVHPVAAGSSHTPNRIQVFSFPDSPTVPPNLRVNPPYLTPQHLSHTLVPSPLPSYPTPPNRGYPPLPTSNSSTFFTPYSSPVQLSTASCPSYPNSPTVPIPPSSSSPVLYPATLLKAKHHPVQRLTFVEEESSKSDEILEEDLVSSSISPRSSFKELKKHTSGHSRRAIRSPRKRPEPDPFNFNTANTPHKNTPTSIEQPDPQPKKGGRNNSEKKSTRKTAPNPRFRHVGDSPSPRNSPRNEKHKNEKKKDETKTKSKKSLGKKVEVLDMGKVLIEDFVCKTERIDRLEDKEKLNSGRVLRRSAEFGRYGRTLDLNELTIVNTRKPPRGEGENETRTTPKLTTIDKHLSEPKLGKSRQRAFSHESVDSVESLHNTQDAKHKKKKTKKSLDGTTLSNKENSTLNQTSSGPRNSKHRAKTGHFPLKKKH